LPYPGPVCWIRSTAAPDSLELGFEGLGHQLVRWNALDGGSTPDLPVHVRRERD